MALVFVPLRVAELHLRGRNGFLNRRRLDRRQESPAAVVRGFAGVLCVQEVTAAVADMVYLWQRQAFFGHGISIY